MREMSYVCLYFEIGKLLLKCKQELKPVAVNIWGENTYIRITVDKSNNSGMKNNKKKSDNSM